MRSKKKIFNKFNFNIGTILFMALFFYVIISVFMYITAKHITRYQVSSGPLTKNQTYTGIILRSEAVYTADSSGFVTYYAPEGQKVKTNGIVCTIGEEQMSSSEVTLDKASLEKIRSDIAKFSLSFDSNDFNSIYNFKYKIEGDILQYSGLYDTNSEETISGRSILASPQSGTVMYTLDGYENLTEESITTDVFNQKNYQIQDLKTKDSIESGNAVYKLITDDSWTLVIPLTTKQMAKLASTTRTKVKFLKDNVTEVGDFKVLIKEDAYYGEITFATGMSRYASDRFLNIELATDVQVGLKVPLSALVTKEFYTIPVAYKKEETDGNSSFSREYTDKDGNVQNESINTIIYRNENDLCYVDKQDFNEGDILVNPNTGEKYTIHDTGALQGVYCINKGYAVFRQVKILDQDEEYCIVQTGMSYSLSQYDYIVLNSNEVTEEDILY